MKFSKIGIIGAGTMGSGIAQVCAAAGLDVLMLDISDAAVARGLSAIATSLDRLVKKEKLKAEEREILFARIRGATQYTELADVDLVVEAATENPDLKLKIMKQADGIMRPDAILASNTSSISITTLWPRPRAPTDSLACIFSIRCP
jgi:3-hydroxybutyryl-CoA dehydrogenase